MLSFGQEVGVSSIQLISAFSAIANGGVLMQPMIVKSLVDINGNVLESFSPIRRRRVISEESARTLTGILVGVVEEGTGKRARIPGYKAAGKTGTAQKIEGGTYSHTKFASSFVGYVPAYKPEIAILVVVDEPCGKPSECYGGRVAGPVFRRIAVQTLKYLEIPPEGTETRFAANIPAQLNTAGVTLVVAQGGDKPHPYAKMIKVKDNTYYKAEAEFVNDCYLTLKEGTDIKKAEVYMPDVHGMTMREVLRMLAPYRLKIRFAGSGIAVRQIPRAGAEIHPGTKCSITFRN
jgi:stage V sporulation protein D (sporulation-specific penicillin-binding protein)